MINVKDLTPEQLQSLECMADFNCHGIYCGDCPFNLKDGCGSDLARDILDQYKKEIKQ